jgi:hypothetical protein
MRRAGKPHSGLVVKYRVRSAFVPSLKDILRKKKEQEKEDARKRENLVVKRRPIYLFTHSGIREHEAERLLNLVSSAAAWLGVLKVVCDIEALMHANKGKLFAIRDSTDVANMVASRFLRASERRELYDHKIPVQVDAYGSLGELVAVCAHMLNVEHGHLYPRRRKTALLDVHAVFDSLLVLSAFASASGDTPVFPIDVAPWGNLAAFVGKLPGTFVPLDPVRQQESVVLRIRQVVLSDDHSLLYAGSAAFINAGVALALAKLGVDTKLDIGDPEFPRVDRAIANAHMLREEVYKRMPPRAL